MLLARPARSIHPRRFGRGPLKDATPAASAVAAPTGISDDMKLFLTTFAAGFVFVSVFFG